MAKEFSRDDVERAFAKKAELINLRSSDPDTFQKTIAILRQNCQEEKARRVEQGRFYNQANADADFRFWTTVPTWTPEEATALSFGKEPRRVNPKTLGELDDDECAFRDLYLARLSEIRVRFRAPDDARPAQVDAASILKWLDEVKIEYPTELRTNSNSTPTKTTEYNQSAQTNKYNTVLKMLFAVVNGKPIYSPDGHHEAVARIERALRNAELQVSVETIRRHWSAAVELVDPMAILGFEKKD